MKELVQLLLNSRSGFSLIFHRLKVKVTSKHFFQINSVKYLLFRVELPHKTIK